VAVPLGKRVKRAVRSVLVVAAIRLLSRLPRRLAWSLGTFLGRLAWPLAGKTRRLALAGLATAFPEKTDAERDMLYARMTEIVAAYAPMGGGIYRIENTLAQPGSRTRYAAPPAFCGIADAGEHIADRIVHTHFFLSPRPRALTSWT